MNRAFSQAMGGTALAFSLFLAPVSGAVAGQTLEINTPGNYEVCGNSVEDWSDPAYKGIGHCTLSRGDPNGNTLTMGNDANFGTNYIYGGFDLNQGPPSTASNNRVNFSGTAGFVRGGEAWSYGVSDINLEATANGNTVSMTGGKAGSILGAYSICSSCTAIASNNTVLITGTIGYDGSGEVYIGGGAAQGEIAIAENNTVTISGTANIPPLGFLYGGDPNSINNDATHISTNNTLNLHIGGLSVYELRNFQNLNFHIPANLGTGSMITINSGAFLGSNTAVAVELPSGTSYKAGDRIVLIDASKGGNGLVGSVASPITSLTPGVSFTMVPSEWGSKRLVVEVGDDGTGPLPPSAVFPDASGTIDNLSLSCLFQAPENVQDKQKKIYVAGTLSDFSMFFFMNSEGGWEQYLGGDWPAWRNEVMTISPYNIVLANDLDVRGLLGFMILVGWGDNEMDVVMRGQFETCYTITDRPG